MSCDTGSKNKAETKEKQKIKQKAKQKKGHTKFLRMFAWNEVKIGAIVYHAEY